MQHGQRGSFQLMKSLNRAIILNKIRIHGPISRADIAKETTLTPPTVSNIVKELIETGLVIETTQGESKGGRKPTLLVINADSFYIIGVDIGPKVIRIIITDLTGTIINSNTKEIPTPLTNKQLIEVVKTEIRQLLHMYPNSLEKFIGIGVGMHGMVDVANGVSLFAPSLGLKDIPIKTVLEEEFYMTVLVENDARVMALGESWFGKGNEGDNTITINVGQGIGAGIVIDGNLFHGDHYIAGEIGHMTIDISGVRCSCGNYGCLETVAAGPAIAQRAKREISIGKESILRSMVNNDLSKITGKLVHEAAKKGDSLSIAVLRETGLYLGIGLTNLIHIINPKRIVIGGGVSKAGDFVLQSIRETIQNRALTKAAKETEIVISDFGDYGTAIGAVTLVLDYLFSASQSE